LPTPVSALIHAATLVTAGIYLLLRSSPLLEFSSTALLIITLVGATTAFFAATCGLVQNDLKRIIAFSTISQLGYFKNKLLLFIIIIIFNLTNEIIFDINFSILQAACANVLPISNNSNLNEIKKFTDKFFNFKPSIKYLDKYTDFSYSGRSIIKQKYLKIKGIYLWINNINNRSYVGKSVNLYIRISKYFSYSYINENKNKMAICGSIYKNNINNFTLYILEIIDKKESNKYLSDRENFWYNLLKPSYNIQSILQPFTGINHYRFGKTVPDSVKLKISNKLKNRILSEEVKLNHIIGARKKAVYCYDFETGKYLMKFDGIRLATRALNLKDSFYIRYRIDKIKPLDVKIDNKKYKMLFKSSKTK